MGFWRTVLCVCVFSSLALANVSELRATNDAAPREIPGRIRETPVGASSTWVVVNLFTGKSSKQAVIVRDKLVGLGAEGPGIILPYNEITVENVKKLRPAFLVLSPNGMPWCKYRGRNGAELQEFFKSLKIIIEEMEVPVIGICGGHQALALAFGGKVGPIRGGEDDCFPYGKNPTERGRHNIFVVNDDPLFHDMGKTLNLVQNHYDEVKKMPQGFVCLAENKLCPYQIIRHPSKPAYGVQAHTEYYLKNRPDGGLLLRNFLNIARNHNRIMRNATESETEPHGISAKKREHTKNKGVR
jgi:GMP synthase (glutamine-hydrolysing)